MLKFILQKTADDLALLALVCPTRSRLLMPLNDWLCPFFSLFMQFPKFGLLCLCFGEARFQGFFKLCIHNRSTHLTMRCSEPGMGAAVSFVSLSVPGR